jgi:formylmethanofuran dehydrogenase subunit E
MTPLYCHRCDKKLSRKTARLIDGKLLCSSCLFHPKSVRVV